MGNWKNIDGHTLLDLGFEPDQWFKDAIAHVNENELSGDQLTEYLKQFIAAPMIKLLDDPVPFSVNIKAEEAQEEDNVGKEDLKVSVNKLKFEILVENKLEEKRVEQFETKDANEESKKRKKKSK